MIRSLFTKLITSYIAVIVVTLMILGLIVFFLIEDYYYSSEKDDLLSEGREVAAVIEDNMSNQQEAPDEVSVLNRYFGSRMLYISRVELESLNKGSNSNKHRGSWLTPEHSKALLNGESLTGESMMHGAGQEIVFAAVPVKSEGQVMGAVILSSPMADLTSAVEALQKLILTAALPALFFSVLLGWILSRYIATPLKSMSDAAIKIAGGNYSERLEVNSGDEIGNLARNFNIMAGSLDDTIETLKTEKAKVNNIISNMAEGVIAVDSSKKIILFNNQAASILGINSNERDGLVSVTLSQLNAGKNIEKVFDYVLENGETLSREYTPDNGRNYTIAHVSPLTNNIGEISGAVGVFQDITEFKKLDQLRRDLLANVSHELRTPLTSVQGYIEAVMDGTVGKQEQNKYLEVAHSETLRLSRLVQDILELTRIDAGKKEWEMNEIDLEELTSSAVGELKPAIERENVSIKINIPEDLPPIIGNEDRIKQVLLNLIDNALIYSSPNSEVFIEAEEGDGEIFVSVSDRGPGIPEAEIDNIWERFYRLDKSRSRESGGTGLGLPIVKEIVESHGGRVSVKSVPGEGSVFTFSIKSV